MCALSCQWGVVKALSREVVRPGLYFSKMQPGEGSGGHWSWRPGPSWRENGSGGGKGEEAGSLVAGPVEAGGDTPSGTFGVSQCNAKK